jgi:hypothetical protein
VDDASGRILAPQRIRSGGCRVENRYDTKSAAPADMGLSSPDKAFGSNAPANHCLIRSLQFAHDLSLSGAQKSKKRPASLISSIINADVNWLT